MGEITKVDRLIKIGIEGPLDFIKDPAWETDAPVPLLPRDLSQRCHRVVQVIDEFVAPGARQRLFAQARCDVLDQRPDAFLVAEHGRCCLCFGVPPVEWGACAGAGALHQRGQRGQRGRHSRCDIFGPSLSRANRKWGRREENESDQTRPLLC